MFLFASEKIFFCELIGIHLGVCVCGETDVNQTLCDTRDKGRVGNEMEDVIKGIGGFVRIDIAAWFSTNGT